MLKDLEEKGRPLNPEEVTRFEKDINQTLPAEYRAFLLDSNGGIPVQDVFSIQNLKDNKEGVVQVFFGIDRKIKSSNLIWNIETYKGRIADDLLPIACTGTGDLICISLTGKDKEKIIFWDSYGEETTEIELNRYFIADSFQEFIDELHEFVE